MLCSLVCMARPEYRDECVSSKSPRGPSAKRAQAMRSYVGGAAASPLSACPREPRMNPRDETDPVHPALRRAEAEVARHLEEACDDAGREDIGQESLEELLRLENELLAAARAVDETVRLRRQLGERPTNESQPPASPPASSPTSSVAGAGERACRLREFSDDQGRDWRVWEVKPGASGRRANPERYLGQYVNGWLAFECLQDEARKRLPNHPADWFGMVDTDLHKLLPQAVEVPKRKPKAGDAVAH
jgi:hypothetical protein